MRWFMPLLVTLATEAHVARGPTYPLTGSALIESSSTKSGFSTRLPALPYPVLADLESSAIDTSVTRRRGRQTNAARDNGCRQDTVEANVPPDGRRGHYVQHHTRSRPPRRHRPQHRAQRAVGSARDGRRRLRPRPGRHPRRACRGDPLQGTVRLGDVGGLLRPVPDLVARPKEMPLAAVIGHSRSDLIGYPPHSTAATNA